MLLTWSVLFSSVGLFCGKSFPAQDRDVTQVDIEIVEERKVMPVPADLFVRARVTSLNPPEPAPISWRYGGEGVGGNPVRGVFLREKPKLGADPGAPQKPDVLAVGEWSAWMPVTEFSPSAGRRLILTVTCGTNGRRVSLSPLRFEGYSTNVTVEFEFKYKDKVIKTVRDSAKEGQIVGLVIPFHRLGDGVTPESEVFLRELTGLTEYEVQRLAKLEALPWAKWPLPKRYAIIGNLSGFSPWSYHGTRYSSHELLFTLCKTLRQFGTTGLRSAPKFLMDMVARREPPVEEFGRCVEIQGMGYPVPAKTPREVPPGAGCPFGEGVAAATEAGVKKALEEALATGVEETWSLTVDEIGSVVDRSAEGKAHFSVCSACRKGFQEYLQKKGLKPGDFGQQTWEGVAPLNIWEKESARPWLKDPGLALAAYYTRMFNNDASAMLFAPLREAFAQANARKAAALADTARRNSPEARQPWVFSFALRGCTFLYGGHSLDFHDFYRLADNAFVYETSNRDPRVWSWDSYLCDVGRVIAPAVGARQGIYIKPHRGAPIQRMLAAVSRGFTMIYWYTFGPEYAKGDSFAGNDFHMALTSKAAHLLGKVEEVLYGAEWAVPAEVAIVNPRTSEIWKDLGGAPEGVAAWENAKWTYTALAHAHIPVDPLDEVMLAQNDLSRYKIIYLLGSHITRAAAEKVRRWVENGGTLYTCAGGLRRDEGNKPLEILAPILGLERRNEVEIWQRITHYGATSLQEYASEKHRIAIPPAGAEVIPDGPIGAGLKLILAREPLQPSNRVEVIARFQDGSPAVVRHKAGKGQVYVVGFFPGLEYAVKVSRPDFDMGCDFDENIRRFVTWPATEAGVRPVVDISVPTVEGVLLRNPKSGARAVTLANWTYRTTGLRKRTIYVRNQPREETDYVRGLAPLTEVRIVLRGVEGVKRITSAILDQPLNFRATSRGVEISIPKLDEGDVILLE